jgi:hypothetical protein
MSRMMMALVALALPSMALAQTPEERIESAKARAASAGIPVSLLEMKVADGKAKGVPMDRIAAAVEKRGASLERSQTALSHGSMRPTEQELDVAADAMDLGVSAAVLQALSETTAGTDRRGAAIAALTQLVAMEVLPAEALDRVTAAFDRGGDALSKLSDEGATARERRGPPAGVGSAGARPTTAGPPAGIPAPGQAPAQSRPPLGRPIGS